MYMSMKNINECIDKIADYEEDSIPVLTEDGKICGILTATDIAEPVDDAMGDDYAKLAGLTSEDDLSELTLVSIKKTSALAYYTAVSWNGSFISCRNI